MVTVSIRETYDLSTKPGKMGMISVHTPSMDVISRAWSGLIQNHKFMKISHCNIRMACASVLPADPLQVGIEGNAIAPQDMFNPILFSAVSNDSFGTIQTRLYSLGYFNDNQSASVNIDMDPLPDSIDDWGVYYSMLASKGFKKAMPQSGLSMSSLRPIVHTMYQNIDTNRLTENGNNDILATWNKLEGAENPSGVRAATIKGRSCPMPAIPTMYWQNSGQNTEQFGSTIKAVPTVVPATYVALILMPPAKLHTLYFRMTVEWFITFKGLRDNMEISTLANLAYEGNNRFYYTNYADQSKSMDNVTNLVDTANTDIEKVM